MKFLKFLLIGVFFGIVLSKSEAISWFRIYEMFKFQSFHMYGIIGSAVVCGAIVIAIMKKMGLKSVEGADIKYSVKPFGVTRYLLGGTIFGMGWAMTGACPGPMFVLAGNGFGVFLVVIVSAMFGTFLYGLVKNRLPH
ncbi:MAG: YeeE/YedE thiosulfate transporter family protein [Cyclobacteriaceae bacterium]